MELGNKIKQLRQKTGLTQDQLASKLGVTAQAVSKWENSVTMPDITLLPQIAIEFGVTIDDLFNLTLEQKLERIENSLEFEECLSTEKFLEYEAFLLEKLEENKERHRVISLLADLYHHRMLSDAKKVSKYARESILLAPEKKACQWLLDMAEGQTVWDWNCWEHSSIIDFYKKVIASDTVTPPTPLPYYYLLDNLIADHRTKEAKEYLEQLKKIPAHKPFLITVYRAHIALAEFDEAMADSLIREGLETYADNGGFLFEAAQYFARKSDYPRALELYERSWQVEETCKPRFTDTLQGIAKIYGIMGETQKVIHTYDRIIDVLKEEWGYKEEDIIVKEVVQQRNALVTKS
ncbi:MAG: helix-turn-helix domain-containing protein [Clostridia bacterium]|nr:helix-turn-helix domain-containing protein [Clostridia bacterium]